LYILVTKAQFLKICRLLTYIHTYIHTQYLHTHMYISWAHHPFHDDLNIKLVIKYWIVIYNLVLVINIYKHNKVWL
jgi:hypothetical protein